MQSRSLFTGAVIFLTAASLGAQTSVAQTTNTQGAAAQAADASSKTRTTTFYDTDAPVPVTLAVNIKRIRGDKGDEMPWRAAELNWTGPDGKTVALPIKARTRGIWRLKNCEFPPVRLNFPEKAVKGTPFEGVNKPKLVSFCKDQDEYEQYVLQELQLYRAYQLLTPVSHKARLARVTYTDSASGKAMTTRYAILYEEPEAMANRLEGAIVDQKGARARDLDPQQAVLMQVFEYMIANTDFSIAGLHNVELLARKSDGVVFPIAYDFDFSGAVNASYATVDPSLRVRRVRDRQFRGYCAPPEEMAPTFALFNAKKDAIYALYEDEVGKLMNKRVVQETLKFYDDFYKTINDPRLVKRNMIADCDG